MFMFYSQYSTRILLSMVVIFCFTCQGCKSGKDVPSEMFELLRSSETGILFVNQVDESVDLNIVTFEMLYNGAGVAIGDITNNGYNDIFLASNMGKSRLFQNEGGFRFIDITGQSGIQTEGKWASGVTLVDINNNGLLDIYISFGGPYADPGRRANELYINNGNGTFTESAREFRIADTGFSTQAVFFDYNKNGFLDLYVLNNGHGDVPPNVIKPKLLNGEHINTDRLYRNNGDGTFTDVSTEAGILIEGYGLGINVFDINGNGWPDIHVANDFLPNDIIYINNGDGTFTNRAADYFRHQSYASMGTDFGDINNNGLMDIITLDMLPESNRRLKQMYESAGYERYLSQLIMGYEPQVKRNVLQLNNGLTPLGHPVFTDIAPLAGVESTDWSWSALFADIDNDGWLDLMITNGLPRNPADNDFSKIKMDILRNGVFDRRMMERLYDELQNLEGIFERNYLFKNNGDLTFSNVSPEWGFREPTYSTGAAFADLNNDGRLDLVINNINQEVFVYRNLNENDNNYLQVKLSGPGHNRQAIGAKLSLYFDGRSLHHQYSVSRGYLSAMATPVHFGLGSVTEIDSLVVIWPDDQKQVVSTLPVNSVTNVVYGEQSLFPVHYRNSAAVKKPLFKNITETARVDFVHEEDNFIDFNIQPLLPHKFSRTGPGIAVGDINKNGLDDFFIGGAFGQSGKIFLQNADGTFTGQDIDVGPAYEKDTGALLFDANGNGHLDLYIASGGSEFAPGSQYYRDRLYFGDSSGTFLHSPDALPDIRASTSVVIAADLDNDGNLELFVGGRVVPNHYPQKPESLILKFSDGKFVDVTDTVAPGLKNTGMVTAAIWSDYNNNGWQDLILAGEWMPITVFENRGGHLVNVTENLGLAETVGWWNSITAADFNQDGYTDYVAGNLGLNSLLRNREEGPVQIHINDFNGNGIVDPVISQIIAGERHPIHLRDDFMMQMPEMARRFPTYASYGEAALGDILTARQLNEAQSYSIHTFQSSIILNRGGKDFDVKPLPIEAQFAPVYGMISGDFDGDGYTDILLTGNSFSTDVFIGRYNAFSGLMLRGDGTGNFEPIGYDESGFFLDQDGKSLVTIGGLAGGKRVLSARNDGRAEMFEIVHSDGYKQLRAEESETSAIITFQDGSQEKVEFYRGSGYLSQSARSVFLTGMMREITFFDSAGITRTITP
ncbi:MAG: RNA-binding protein [Balneolaceae bacterium]|nr:MAG: RNA-binding protein [Balneolaceae bacterium]